MSTSSNRRDQNEEARGQSEQSRANDASAASFVVESLEPRVLLSATLGGAFDADGAEADAIQDALEAADVDIDLDVDGDHLFDSDNDSADFNSNFDFLDTQDAEEDIAAYDSVGTKGEAVPLFITAAAEDGSVEIRNMPEGASLSHGTSQGDGVWSVSVQDLETLNIQLPEDFTGDFDLEVATADANEAVAKLNVWVNEIRESSQAETERSGDVGSIMMSEDGSIRAGDTLNSFAGNEAPETQVDHHHVPAGGAVTCNVLDNDFDPDGDQLSATVETGPANGTLTLNTDGTFEYVPDEGWTGLDRFWYEVNDGNGNAEIVEVCIFTDPPPNLVPDAVDDSFDTTQGQSVSGNVMGNDVDPDGDDFTVSLFSEPSNGTVTLNPDGSFNYVPDPGFLGTDSFEYRALDTDNGGALATVVINVTDAPANEAPVTEVDHQHIAHDEVATGNVLDNDFDPDGDTLTVSVETAPENGSLTLNADGTYEYVPDEGWTGLDRFWYEVNDGNGNAEVVEVCIYTCLLYTSPSPRDQRGSRMPSSA